MACSRVHLHSNADVHKRDNLKWGCRHHWLVRCTQAPQVQQVGRCCGAQGALRWRHRSRQGHKLSSLAHSCSLGQKQGMQLMTVQILRQRRVHRCSWPLAVAFLCEDKPVRAFSVGTTGQGYLWQVHRDPRAGTSWPLAAWSKQLWERWLDGSPGVCLTYSKTQCAVLKRHACE